jgi:hypothetical protein
MTIVEFANLGDDPMADMIRRHEAPIAEAIAHIQAVALDDAIVVITEYSRYACVVGATTRAKFFASEVFGLLGTASTREELRTWPKRPRRILLVAARIEPRGWGFSELEIQESGGSDGKRD